MPWKLVLVIEGDGDPSKAQIVCTDLGFLIRGRGGKVVSADYNDHGPTAPATDHDHHGSSRSSAGDDAALAATNANYRAAATAADAARAHTPGFGNF